jgi:hypothetical protein
MENDLIIGDLVVTKRNKDKMKELIRDMLLVEGINKIHAQELLAGTELYEQVISLKKKKYEAPTIDFEPFEGDNCSKFLY